MCVALREGRKYNAADPNTIKMDCVCVCVGVFAGLVTITRPWTSLGRLLNVSYGLTIGWCSLSASVCLSFVAFRSREKLTEDETQLRERQGQGKTVNVKPRQTGKCVNVKGGKYHAQNMPNFSIN